MNPCLFYSVPIDLLPVKPLVQLHPHQPPVRESNLTPIKLYKDRGVMTGTWLNQWEACVATHSHTHVTNTSRIWSEEGWLRTEIAEEYIYIYINSMNKQRLSVISEHFAESFKISWNRWKCFETSLVCSELDCFWCQRNGWIKLW